jgi:AraC family transcriptional regulator
MLDSAREEAQATTLYHNELIAMRLALVASLVETLMPALPANTDKPAAPGLPKRQLMRVAAYIDANIDEPITLAKLAAAAGLSRMYFARQFRAATGIRPHEYVLRKRVERAQQLLTATSGALADIALSVGFQTQAHFTTVFKKIVGNTPRQWRREQADTA